MPAAVFYHGTHPYFIRCNTTSKQQTQEVNKKQFLHIAIQFWCNLQILMHLQICHYKLQ